MGLKRGQRGGVLEAQVASQGGSKGRGSGGGERGVARRLGVGRQSWVGGQCVRFVAGACVSQESRAAWFWEKKGCPRKRVARGWLASKGLV